MLKITKDPIKGRCFTIAKKVNKGELVLVSEPFVKIPDAQSIRKICTCCVQAPSLPICNPKDRKELPFVCKGCSFAGYCSLQCMEKDRKYHDFECSFWKQNDDLLEEFVALDAYDQDYIRLIFRIIIKASTDRDSFMSIWNLCDNTTAWPQNKLAHFFKSAKIVERFRSWKGFTFPETLLQNVRQRLEILGLEATDDLCYSLLLVLKEECNSFGLYTANYDQNSKEESYGLAIYPNASYFNHSCSPKVKRSPRDDGILEFFAFDDLEIGQEATISYIKTDQDVNSRKKLLREYFLFDCDCVKCKE